MSRLRAPANLPELVRTTFAKARSDGELHYFPTQVTVLRLPSTSIPFQLRFSPALANKPKGPAPQQSDDSKPHKPFDPFDNPPSSLFLTDIGPSHFLVLNKFAVVPEHFILATKEFKPQTHVLEPSDLEATAACIAAFEQARGGGTGTGRGSGGDGLFAFFNCGEHSGASQPHRHIQLLPVAEMKSDLDGHDPWAVLADNIQPQSLPFATFAERVHLGMSGSELHAIHLRLYRLAHRAIVEYTKDSASAIVDSETPPSEGEVKISYNMALTKDTMVVCPRLAEGAQIVDRDGKVAGSIALNGTVLAGTALVKNELEWAALKGDPAGLLEALKAIGVPTDSLHEDAIKL